MSVCRLNEMKVPPVTVPEVAKMGFRSSLLSQQRLRAATTHSEERIQYFQNWWGHKSDTTVEPWP